MTRRVASVLFPALLLGASCTRSAERAAPRDSGADAPDETALDGAPVRLPPPISGGTLLITRDGLRAVAADPDLDRVVLIGIADSTDCPGCDETPRVLSRVAFSPGEEPGRLAEDGAGRVHVVLRRRGAIATVELASGQLLARRPVCGAPRGIAYDSSADVLHVACASGELVTLSPSAGNVQRRLALDVDLRDVVVVPDGLVVSRFKTAELIHLDREGKVLGRMAPAGIVRGPQDVTKTESDPLEPAVAWRTIATSDGNVSMLHQYGLGRAIDLGAKGSESAPSSYAAESGARCGGIVSQAVSTLLADGELQMGAPLPVVALSVDLAASSDGKWFAVAHAGALADKVTLYQAANLPTYGRSPVGCADNEGRVIVDGQPVAVALYPGRTPAAASGQDFLLVQTRAPAALSVYRGFSTARSTVALGGPVVRDAGHDLFHMDNGKGIACAQCHSEGAEDGRVWKFVPLGERRTQALHVGLEGTEPFHWSGNLPSFQALIDEVFVRRMGGTPPSAGTAKKLEKWVYSLRPPASIVGDDDPAAVRGRALYQSSDIGCADCHSGPKDSSEDVGIDSPEKFQIPSLRGVGYRAPFLHNGCAGTLRERFTTPCGGGDLHGKTSKLSASELDDLIAFLNSL